MKTTNRFNLTLISKIATVGLIIFMFFTLMIPIYQIGENHAYRMRIAQAKSSIMELEEIERTLESAVYNCPGAKQPSPRMTWTFASVCPCVLWIVVA